MIALIPCSKMYKNIYVRIPNKFLNTNCCFKPIDKQYILIYKLYLKPTPKKFEPALFGPIALKQLHR